MSAIPYSKTASAICTEGLEHLGIVGSGETPRSEDMLLAIRALESVLEELPLAGYHWPQLSGDVAMTWAGVQAVSLPTDFYNYASVFKTVNGVKVRLQQLTHADWLSLPNRSAVGDVTSFYISPTPDLRVYPTPTSDPSLTIQYQKNVVDQDLTVDVSIPDYLVNPLGYGVANELALKYQVSAPLATEIYRRWMEKRARALESSQSYAPIYFSVDN